MGKSTISRAMFNSYVSHYQSVNHLDGKFPAIFHASICSISPKIGPQQPTRSLVKTCATPKTEAEKKTVDVTWVPGLVMSK